MRCTALSESDSSPFPRVTTLFRPEQLEDEFRGCLELAKYFLGTVGLLEDCTFRFSQWDPANPKNKYEGTPEQWERRSGCS